MIQGEKRESKDRSKKVGIFEAKVVAINPDAEEFKEVLGIELKEDSRATEYLSENSAGNTFLRVDFWLEEVKSKETFKVTFFLEDKQRENKEGTKKQYVNNIGVCSWAASKNDLPEWFARRDYRVANSGEEELYEFLRTWLMNLDYKKDDTVLQLDWKKLMKGNVKDLKDQVNGEYCGNILSLATVTSKSKEEEVDGKTETVVKEYQTIYNKAFLPAYYMKNFRVVNYEDEKVQSSLRTKKPKDLKPYERFVVKITDSEYGCKDYYILKELQDYNSNENPVATDTAISPDDSKF